jgi:hypothetical protein
MPWRRIGEWMYSSTHSLTLALDGDEWSASRPGRFTPRERAPGTQCIGGCVGLRAVLDAVVKRKIPSPRRESNPRTPIVQPVARRYTDWAITARHMGCRNILQPEASSCSPSCGITQDLHILEQYNFTCCFTWYKTPKNEHRWRTLRRVFGSNREKWTNNWENYVSGISWVVRFTKY